MFRTTFLLLLILILTGCNSGTYQQYNLGVGYQSEQNQDNEFSISYTDAPRALMDKVNDFALLRSAEVTLENGYNYFVVTKAINNRMALIEQESRNNTMLPPDAQGALPNPGAENQTNRKSELTIECYKDKPETKGAVYDAGMIVQALRSEYEIK